MCGWRFDPASADASWRLTGQALSKGPQAVATQADVRPTHRLTHATQVVSGSGERRHLALWNPQGFLDYFALFLYPV